MQFVHFKVPPGTSLDSDLVREASLHVGALAQRPIGSPYFANNDGIGPSESLNVYCDVLEASDG